MYKRILFLLFIFLLCGCSNKKSNINTKILNGDNTLIGINYPITNTRLDNYIQEDIDKIYDDFITQYQDKVFLDKSELNIDYLFYEKDNFISVGLFIYENVVEEVNSYIITYAYNKKSNRLLSLNDITNDIDIIEEYSSNYSKFTFNNQFLTIYDSDNSIMIPIQDLNFNFDLDEETISRKTNLETVDKIIDPNDKVVALTFDDGPSKYTEAIIDYLNEAGCNGTFFILGNKVELYADVLQKSISYGNELGNHSYNHKWLAKLDSNEIINQITKTQDLIKEFTGYTPAIIRPTYGTINNKIKELTDLQIILWNVDTLDWKYKNIDRIVNNATKNLKDGNIILMHDTYKRTLEAIKKIVPIIKEKGFTCVTISELNEIKLIREKINE